MLPINGIYNDRENQENWMDSSSSNIGTSESDNTTLGQPHTGTTRMRDRFRTAALNVPQNIRVVCVITVLYQYKLRILSICVHFKNFSRVRNSKCRNRAARLQWTRKQERAGKRRTYALLKCEFSKWRLVCSNSHNSFQTKRNDLKYSLWWRKLHTV